MSDTTFKLTVLSCHGIIVEPFNSNKPTRVPSATADQPDLLVYEFTGVADLPCIPVLLAQSVAFDLERQGGGLVEGVQYSRYSPNGKHHHFFVRDDEINPELSTLMKLLHKPEDLVKLIKDHHKRTVPLPWDNQEVYGKIHRTINLIKPL